MVYSALMSDETMQVGPFLYRKVQEQSPKNKKNQWSVWHCPDRPTLAQTPDGWVRWDPDIHEGSTPEEALGHMLDHWTLEGVSYYLTPGMSDQTFRATPIPAVPGYPPLEVREIKDGLQWCAPGGRWCSSEAVLTSYWALKIREVARGNQSHIQGLYVGLKQLRHYQALLGESDEL
jgi:hypothetical protein